MRFKGVRPVGVLSAAGELVLGRRYYWGKGAGGCYPSDDKLGVTTKALILPLETEENLDLAARNNPRLTVVRALGVSIVDLLDHDTVVVSEPALVRLTEVLAS